MTLLYKNKSFIESVLCYSKRIFIFIIVLKRRGGKGVSQRWNRGAAVSCFRGKAPAYNSDQHGKCRYLGTMKKKKKKKTDCDFVAVHMQLIIIVVGL